MSSAHNTNNTNARSTLSAKFNVVETYQANFVNVTNTTTTVVGDYTTAVVVIPFAAETATTPTTVTINSKIGKITTQDMTFTDQFFTPQPPIVVSNSYVYATSYVFANITAYTDTGVVDTAPPFTQVVVNNIANGSFQLQVITSYDFSLGQFDGYFVIDFIVI